MASRLINDLTPQLQVLTHKFLAECYKSKIRLIITCTARTFQEQVALYAQGRQELDEVNDLRLMAGLAPINEIENKRKVTWTMKSKHIINLMDAEPGNDKSRAFDIAIVGADGKVTWDIKANVNENEIPDYEEAGLIGESLGLTWGGRWKKPDYPHFQYIEV